ncbi:hypothetical protein [Paraburkholderia heleia]|uniref:hypothetical protein n=1 Tax=Paraburkholderia heleia TaxID=634127 RepID=UPI002AB7BE98|nr:hypothetical protein [Paraburkholderia heleia]
MAIYGLPQALTGNETVTIQQQQNGQSALCTMPLSDLLTYINANAPELWVASLPTALPAKPGIPWNNAGLVSVS